MECITKDDCVCNRLFRNEIRSDVVPKTGLEPVRSFGTKDFKSFASAYSATSAKVLNIGVLSTVSGGANQNRTGDGDFADLCLTAWLWRRISGPIAAHLVNITTLCNISYACTLKKNLLR